MGVSRVGSDTCKEPYDASITYTIVGGTDAGADVTARFPHDGTKDRAGTDARRWGDFLNGRIDEADLARAVVEGHQGGILRPEGLVAGPGAGMRSFGSWAAVCDIATTHAGTAGATAVAA